MTTHHRSDPLFPESSCQVHGCLCRKLFALSIKMKYASFFVVVCVSVSPQTGIYLFFFSFYLCGARQIDEQECMCLEPFKQQRAPQKQQVPFCEVSPGWEGNDSRYTERPRAGGLFYFRELISLLWLYFKCHPKVVEKRKRKKKSTLMPDEFLIMCS